LTNLNGTRGTLAVRLLMDEKKSDFFLK